MDVNQNDAVEMYRQEVAKVEPLATDYMLSLSGW